MDRVKVGYDVFNALTSRLAQYMTDEAFQVMAVDDKIHNDFKVECVAVFRSATQLLEEGHISEQDFLYIVQLAFWIEDMIQEKKH